MKRFLLFSILCINTVNLHAQNMVWGDVVPVAPASYGYVRPHVAICNGIPVVVWGDQDNHKIYASRYINNSFTTPVDLSPNLPAFEEGWMAHEIASAGDSLFVVFSDADATNIYIVRSLDGGLTFGDTVRVNHLTGYPVEASVDMLPGGNPVVTFIFTDDTPTPPRNMVCRSTDGGMSFLPEVDATDFVQGQACDCCKASLVSKDDHVVVLFRNNDSNIRDIWSAISYDNGDTYTTSAQLDFSNWNISNCPTSPPDGYIYGDSLISVFMNASSGQSKVFVSALDLVTLQQPQQQWIHQPVNTANQNYPRIAGHNNSMGVVWQQPVSGMVQTMFSSSANGPNGLMDTAYALAQGLDGNHTYPDIALDNGIYHVVFESDADERVYYISNNSINSSPSINISSEQLFNIFHFDKSTCFIRFNVNADVSSVRLISVSGQIIRTYTPGNVQVGNDLVVSTKLLSDGMYFVQLISDRGVETKRIVK